MSEFWLAFFFFLVVGSPGVGKVRPFSQDIYQTTGQKRTQASQHVPQVKNARPLRRRVGTTHQRRRGGCGVQEGREVLVCVRVLVLVVVLMELKGKGRDTGLVLRSSTRGARGSTRRRRASGRAAARSRRVVFSAGRAASALTL